MQTPRGDSVYESSKENDKLIKKEKARRLDPMVAVAGHNRDYTS